jgi:hypothetical protein
MCQTISAHCEDVMFDVVSDLKDRLESGAIEFYEKWDMIDNCGWVIPADTNIEEFEAKQANMREKEIAAVTILEMLKDTIDAVSSPIVERTAELYNSVGEERYGKTAFRVIETVGFGFDPADATEFVQTFNESLTHPAEQWQSLG